MQRTILATALALVAFAANSLLCRAALGEGAIDAYGFTLLRIGSGAAVLVAVAATRGTMRFAGRRGRWSTALALMGYALAFSLAYRGLSAGTGALLLFGAVQVTMFGAGRLSGERAGWVRWTGLVIAFAGLVYLVSPGLAAPSPVHALSMVIAGVCWGVYSLLAARDREALASTTGSFVRALPFAFLAAALFADWQAFTPRGVVLALLSGGVASGLGYVAWTVALGGLRATSASLLQLAVPVIAAGGGIVLLGEAVTLRLVVASLLTLGGVAGALVLGGNRN